MEWPSVESTLGLRLPEDYKRLTATYDPGRFANYPWILTRFLASVLSGDTTVPQFPGGLLQGGTCFEPSRLDKWSPPLPPARAPSHTQDIRAWGRANGYDVPMRGRIPAGVRQAWEQAHRDN
ncbi:Lsr2 dimerization domain-containing protein [Streptomyces sp. NRRL WC-3725]|uniref:Lsr2 family DNA-binding protein n=1 Tax=Streptomyces sp. NRRL WC-3725 TaxID=1463933 RepID=UPI000AE9D971|nr:histone-like nucleoid-structuring protein Lsr2 [Streptomyces sp. NRRL WC-3725]